MWPAGGTDCASVIITTPAPSAATIAMTSNTIPTTCFMHHLATAGPLPAGSSHVTTESAENTDDEKVDTRPRLVPP